MKNLLFLILVLPFFMISCKKNDDDPKPNANNGGSQSFTEKNPRFYYLGNLNAQSQFASLFWMTDTTDWNTKYNDVSNPDIYHPTLKGSLGGYPRQNNSACNESTSGLGTVNITTPGRYYYKVETGNWAIGFTITHKGYFDVSPDGSLTYTELIVSSTYRTVFQDCNGSLRYTIVYY